MREVKDLKEEINGVLLQLAQSVNGNSSELELLFRDYMTDASGQVEMDEFLEFVQMFTIELDLQSATNVFGLYYLYKTKGRACDDPRQYCEVMKMLQYTDVSKDSMKSYGRGLAEAFASAILNSLKSGSNVPISVIHRCIEEANEHFIRLGITFDEMFFWGLLSCYRTVLMNNYVMAYNKYIAAFLWNYMEKAHEVPGFSWDTVWEIFAMIFRNVARMDLPMAKKQAFLDILMAASIADEMKLGFLLLDYGEVIKENMVMQDNNIPAISMKFQQLIGTQEKFLQICSQADDEDTVLQLLHLQSEAAEDFQSFFEKIIQVMTGNAIAAKIHKEILEIVLYAYAKKEARLKDSITILSHWKLFPDSMMLLEMAGQVLDTFAMTYNNKEFLEILTEFYESRGATVPSKLQMLNCLVQLQEELSMDMKQLKKRLKTAKYEESQITFPEQSDDEEWKIFCCEYGRAVAKLYILCDNPAILEMYNCNLKIKDELFMAIIQEELIQLLQDKCEFQALVLIGWLIQNELVLSVEAMMRVMKTAGYSATDLYNACKSDSKKILKCIRDNMIFETIKLDKNMLFAYVSNLNQAMSGM